MKKRVSFVSNSSSASFLIMTDAVADDLIELVEEAITVASVSRILGDCAYYKEELKGALEIDMDSEGWEEQVAESLRQNLIHLISLSKVEVSSVKAVAFTGSSECNEPWSLEAMAYSGLITPLTKKNGKTLICSSWN